MTDKRIHRSRVLGRLVALEILVLVVLLLLPPATSSYVTVVATKIVILSLLAISFDIVWGYSGVMSFGQSLFFGGAGYAATLLIRYFDAIPMVGVLSAAIVVGAGLAYVVSFLLFSRKVGASSAMLAALGSLTAAYIAERMVRRSELLGGQNGLTVPNVPLFGDFYLSPGPHFYYFALFMLLAVYLLCRAVLRSQAGLVLAGARTDERRIAFFGYDVVALRTATFTFAGGVAGLSGALYALHEGFIAPNVIGITTGTQAVLYSLLGGAGTLVGSVVGVVAIEGLSYQLADRFPFVWPVLLGGLLLVLVIFRPGGLVGLIVSEAERVGRFGAPSDREGPRQ